jgi:hypothetical protein
MISCCRWTFVVGFTLGFALPHYATAQVEHPLSVDGAVGIAHVSSSEFLTVGDAVGHIAIADRVLQRGRFAAYAEASYDWLGQFFLIGADPDLTCIGVRPGGGCLPHFPGATGASASIGLLFAPSARVETRVGVGGAAYSIDGTQVGAAVGHFDAALFPSAQLGLFLGAQVTVVPRYRHDRLTMVPVLFGLRAR